MLETRSAESATGHWRLMTYRKVQRILSSNCDDGPYLNARGRLARSAETARRAEAGIINVVEVRPL